MPHRVLFVLGTLGQGGSERYLYEVARTIDRRFFSPEVLLLAGLNPDDYYYPLLREFGVPVWGASRPRQQGGLRRRLARALSGSRYPAPAFLPPDPRISWSSYLEPFDLVAFLQIESYLALQGVLPEGTNTVVHLMSLLIQYEENPYAGLDRKRQHRFIVAAPAQRLDLARSGFDGDKPAFVPLMMDLHDRATLPAPDLRGTRRIGVFTRLSSEKPIHPFFFALRELSQAMDVDLHVFGAGDVKPWTKLASVAHVPDRVHFRGHVPDLLTALRNEQISLVWYTCYDAVIQYGGVEIGSLGVPMLFWNLCDASHEHVLAETRGAVRAYSEVSALVDATRLLLADRDALAHCGERLSAYIREAHNIESHIHYLEAHYREILESKPVPTGAPTNGRV